MCELSSSLVKAMATIQDEKNQINQQLSQDNIAIINVLLGKIEALEKRLLLLEQQDEYLAELVYGGTAPD